MSITHFVFKDCKKAMGGTVIVHIIEECLLGILSVYTAGILGRFADAVFLADFSLGLNHAVKLMTALFITILMIPLIGLFGNFIMLKQALLHDRMILERFFDKTYESIHKYDPGVFQNLLEDDPNILRIHWVLIITNLSMITVTSIYLFWNTFQISIGFALIVFAISLLKLTVPFAVKKLEAKYDLQTREYHDVLHACETDITEKPHLVKLFGLSTPLINRIDTLYQQYFNNVFSKSTVCTTLANQISSFLNTFCIILILLIGAIFTANGIITAGAVAAMVGYFSIFQTIMEKASYVIRYTPIANQVATRMTVFYEEPEDLSGINITDFSDIEATSLSFSYDTKQIFSNLSFHIKKGCKTAICGTNGSGKSTLLQILCGLQKQYQGSLKINGTELSKLSIDNWRGQFAYATQDPHLFTGTVRENIQLGNKHAEPQQINELMAELGILHLADRQVSFNQNDLSGGEKQKISLARALLKNTPVLILDEPNNNLDKSTQKWLADFIASTSKTVLFISHENQLLEGANQVINFSDIPC